MRIHADEEIIEKASLKINKASEGQDNLVDITVDFEDERGITHSYVVTFKKGNSDEGQEWIPLEISEISSL